MSLLSVSFLDYFLCLELSVIQSSCVLARNTLGLSYLEFTHFPESVVLKLFNFFFLKLGKFSAISF